MKSVLVTTIGGGLFGIALGIAGFGPWQWQWWLIFLTALTWRLCGRMKSVQTARCMLRGRVSLSYGFYSHVVCWGMETWATRYIRQHGQRGK